MKLRIAIASDLHVGGDAGSDGGWLHASSNRVSTGEDLVGGLRNVIKTEKLGADILFCPGDLADKADAAGLIRCWDVVQQIRTELSADIVIAATGNHDTDSRGLVRPGDPWMTLKELYPPFPIGDEDHDEANNEYWARGWCLVDYGPCRVLNLNSCYLHADPALAKRGHVSAETIQDIVGALESGGSRSLNVLLTHHHPMKFVSVNAGDESHMDGGEFLLDKLLNLGVGPWLAIHGHRHLPRMDYFGGGSQVLPIFSAGSLSARLWDEAAAVAKNQFYVVEIEVDSELVDVDPLSARCFAWSWIPNGGWRVSGESSGIMSGSGFGWRTPVSDCVSTITTAFEKAGTPWLTRADLVSLEPRYELLTTKDQLLLHVALEKKFAVVCRDGLLVEFGKKS